MVVLWVVLEGLLGTNFSIKIVVPNAGGTKCLFAAGPTGNLFF